MAESQKFDLARGFLRQQRAMSAALEIPLAFTEHPTALGDASEANWEELLRRFLPGRYAVGKVFALDHEGNTSRQIDLAIYDRQYAPLWFEAGGHRYVPVESIYAALEVKPEANAKYMRQAAEIVASVRSLKRTSGPIVDIHGVHEGPSLEARPILGGLLALQTKWAGGLGGTTATQNLAKHTGDQHLDLGIVLLDKAFNSVPAETESPLLESGLHWSHPGTQLAFFVLSLFRRLQAIGTALAVDLSVYQRVLDAVRIENYTEGDLTP